jgi:putative CocE/NonD family hydrolase
MRRTTLLLIALAACAPRAIEPPRAVAAPPDDGPLFSGELKDDAAVAHAIREHYVKYEYRIPMRDGARLFTVAYVPKDRARTYPIMMTRTPYGVVPYGVDNYPAAEHRVIRRFAPSGLFVREGYIFVHQDVRGRMMSEGSFVDIRPLATQKGQIDESTDAYDTIDWLVRNVPANNGKVGVWGVSYPGFYAAQAAVNAHPALKAASPQAPVTEWFLGDDFHHNGALFLGDAFDFYSSFGKARPKPVKKMQWGFDYESGDAYEFFLDLGPIANANERHFHGELQFWNDMFAHPNRDDFWKARDPRFAYRDAKPAIMTVGGWFDAEDLWGALATYRAWNEKSPRSEVSLVMGPWPHGGWARSDGDALGELNFGAKTSDFYHDKIELPFFQRHLKGKVAPPPPEAWVFETGTNLWQRYAAWPPAEAKAQTLFFHARGKLSAAPPAAHEDESGADAYVSDPARPVPYMESHGNMLDHDYMIADQRFASRRTDVLVYQTDPLAADVTLAGPLEASLSVTTTGTDADFVVKLVDVYPPDAGAHGGYQQLVRGEVMRGRYRRSYEKPEPFVPNEPALVRFSLPDVSHTFRTGHRVMVQVQSSWFPLVDRNPQTFVDVYRAKEADFRAATHRVMRTPERPSGLKVTVARGAL